MKYLFIKKYFKSGFLFSLPKIIASGTLFILPLLTYSIGFSDLYIHGLKIFSYTTLSAIGYVPLIIWLKNSKKRFSLLFLILSIIVSVIFLINSEINLWTSIAASVSVIYFKVKGGLKQYHEKFFLSSFFQFLAPVILSFCIIFIESWSVFIFLIFLFLILKEDFINIKIDFNKNVIESFKFLINISNQMIYSWLFRGGLAVLFLSFGFIDNDITVEFQLIARTATLLGAVTIIFNQIRFKNRLDIKSENYFKNLINDYKFISFNIVIMFFVILFFSSLVYFNFLNYPNGFNNKLIIISFFLFCLNSIDSPISIILSLNNNLILFYKYLLSIILVLISSFILIFFESLSSFNIALLFIFSGIIGLFYSVYKIRFN